MPRLAWVTDSICGCVFGMVKGMTGEACFTSSETEQIAQLKQLTFSTLQKSPEFSTEASICEAIREGKQIALDKFAKSATPEMIEAGVVTAAQLVCTQAFKHRFADVLKGACLNLVGC